MARSEYDVREEYTGTGALATYSFDFKIEDETHLLVIELNTLGVEVERVRGDDVVYLSSITFDNVNGGGSVTLAANLTTNHKLILLLANDEPTQPYEFINKSSFTLKRFELALDFILGPVQRLFYLMGRTMKLNESTPTTFDPTLPANIHEVDGGVIAVNEDGTGFTMLAGIASLAGDLVETIDDTDYTATPELSDYELATNKIIFAGTGITDLKSMESGVAGQRLMLVNAQAATINVVNEDALETAGNRISTGTGTDIDFTTGAALFLNYDGNSNTWRVVGGTGGAGVLLGLPTDGDYGGPIGPIAGIQQGDRMEDALDKVDTILGLLAPEPPGLLSTKQLNVSNSYPALESTAGTLHPIVVNTTTPVMSPGLAQTFANSFLNGKSGVLSAEVDAVEVGSITLTPADDSGTNGDLDILFDYDPYAGVFGREGFWMGLIARISSSALSVGAHTAQLKHTEAGNSPLINFRVDNAITPTVGALTLDASAATSSHRSGVPGVAAGQNINVTFNVSDAVKSHYNDTRIARASSPQTSAVNAPLPGTPPDADDVIAANINVVVSSGAYSENVVVTGTGYNSAGGTDTNTGSDNIRVDTVGSEASRLVSGTGQYPASGYGGAFNSNTSLATASNFELQYLNGLYRIPPSVDYTGKTPAGPDYTSLSYDSHNSMRWATFSLGSVSSASSVSFSITSPTNFGGSTIVSGMELYVRVDGATPTTGWLNANAAYPGVGNPTNNGDAALNVGSSTSTSKVVTFGAAVKTGTVYVRIGIPSGSTKTFGGIA